MGGEDTGGGRGLGRGSPGPQLPGGVAEATARGVVDRLFRQESGRAVATLIRVLGDFDLAEEAVQDAFAVALERWPTLGLPDNPAAWITTTARNRAIDRLRRDRRLAVPGSGDHHGPAAGPGETQDPRRSDPLPCPPGPPPPRAA